jgi:FAD:protein FMN transferase
VATSGTAARGAHVLDPRTGEPGGDGLLSVTVVAPDLLWADVYATAAFARGPGCDAWLATLSGTTSLVVPVAGEPRTVRGVVAPRSGDPQD